MALLGDRALAASQALEVAPSTTSETEVELQTESAPAAALERPDDNDALTESVGVVTSVAGRDSAADAGISRVARGIRDTESTKETQAEPSASGEEEEQSADPNSLIHTQSSSSLATDSECDAASSMPMPPLQRAQSDDPAAASPEMEMEIKRPALSSNASSVESNESDGAASSASVAPTPSALPAKSNSYKTTRRDAPLRIFFPTDDLAMKAILSPPTLRNNGPANVRTQSASQLSSDVTKPSLAESFLETTSRLFFLRGSSNAASPTKTTATTADDTTAGTAPVVGRPSTTSVALEEDLSKLNNAIVAANPNLPPPPFANMFSCENCHEDIGSLLTQGRHHCRNCGGSFCATCSSKTSIVPYQLYLSKGEQRVCDGCFNRIREFHAQAQTTQITWSGLTPPATDVLAREFDLAPHEAPVTVFNCSYFVDFAPFYGHLFLTREHVCFRGYKTHKIKIAFADLHSLIKPEFYYINALQINTKSTKEKHFFAEFNGLRDLAFLRMDQLVRAFQDGKKKEHTAAPLSNEMLKQQAIGRRRSYKVLAAAAGTSDDLASFLAASTAGFHDVDDDDDDESDKRSNVAFSEEHDEAMSTGSSASDESAEPVAPDALLTKMTGLLDCELRADTQSVFELLWGNDQGREFLRDHMEKTKDIDIELEDWQPITSTNEAETSKGFVISKENDYSLFRNVRSKHPPKTKFPGLPPYAGCCRLQRLRVEKSADGTKWTRFVVADLLRMSGIPFSDYFEIETRWVFTRDGKRYCHVQAGLIVNFIKSTWFKSQIDSSTRSESKEGLEHWAKNAIVFLQDHTASGAGLVLRASLGTSATPRSTVSEELGESARRLSTTSSSDSRARSGKRPSATMESTLAPASNAAGSDLTALMANPQSLLQLLTLVVLLYCVVVMRSQQVQLQRLSETTVRLLDKLGAPSSAGVLSNSGVCEQTLVDGAVTSLRQYFESQQPHSPH